MFRGILITQDNADKVRDFNISPEFGGAAAQRALCLRKPADAG